MTIRRWAAGASLLVILAILAFLFVQMSSPTLPVAADDYRGHPASPTPTTQSSTTGATAAAAVTLDTGVSVPSVLTGMRGRA